MFAILLSIVLIFFSILELMALYRSSKKKRVLNLLLNDEPIKAKNVFKKDKTTAFEKIVAKNSSFVGFLQQFQTKQLWKVYAVIISFSVFFIFNQINKVIELSQQTIVILLFVLLVAIIMIPEKIVKSQTQKRIRMVSKDLPLVIDMMAIMIKSGMTIENGFKYLSTKVSEINRDIASVLERACLMMDVNGIEPAIDLIYREVPSKEMRMFCSTLKRSINYGNSVYESLLELSLEIRDMQRLELEEKIAAISAKMTVPMMLFIMFPVLVVIGGPIIIKLVGLF